MYNRNARRAPQQTRACCPIRREIAVPYSAVYVPSAPSLAAVYGIKQTWQGVDDSFVGFSRGTIFNELDKPFKGDKCKNGGFCK